MKNNKLIDKIQKGLDKRQIVLFYPVIPNLYLGNGLYVKRLYKTCCDLRTDGYDEINIPYVFLSSEILSKIENNIK